MSPSDADDLAGLAQRMRLVRGRFGYSQRKLARLSGVSNAAISMIEKGTLNPSIGTMVKILRAFPISMAEFWQSAPTEMEKVVFRFDELRRITNNRVRFWQIAGAGEHSMLFQYERYEPGADTGVSQMDQACEMIGMVIEGRLNIRVGDHADVLGEGDVYRFDGRVPHRLFVRGKRPVIMVSCTTPAVF